jgi:glycosyltransferase involved in cell wall biosynthesis
MILRNLEVLAGEESFLVQHLPFHFTQAWTDARRLSLTKVWELFRVAARLFRLRLEGPIDCLIYPIGGPNLVPVLRDIALLPLCLIMAARVVVHIHAGGIADALPGFPAPVRRIARLVYGRCSAAIVLTEFSRSDAKCLGVERIELAPNTLPDAYRLDWVHRGGDGVTTLLYIGHLGNPKGTAALLHSFASIHKHYPNLRLSLAGEPLRPYSVEELQSSIAVLGLETLVDIRGVISGEDKWRCFGQADLLVFPSTAPESFPLVLLEGMMWALPIVATDWRAHAEILGSPPGGICYKVGSDPCAALRGALEQALRMSTRWGGWGAANRQHYLESYFPAEEPLVGCIKRILQEEAARGSLNARWTR